MMNNELTDSALDAAAKELMVDAPDELLKGVMYRIEKDATPKRFAFGRFTAFGAVAAAILIFIGIQSLPDSSTGGSKLFSGLNTSDSAAPEHTPAPAAAPQAMPEMATMQGEAAMDEGGTESMTAADTAGNGEASFAAPPELTPIEQALYDYLDTLEVEILSVENGAMTYYDDYVELVATVTTADERLEITVIEREGQFDVSSTSVPAQ